MPTPRYRHLIEAEFTETGRRIAPRPVFSWVFEGCVDSVGLCP